MKLTLKSLFTVVAALALSLTVASAGGHKLDVKEGSTAYVCGCGEKCGCEVASMKAGKCSCGHELQKVSVTKVKENKAYYTVDGKERSVKTLGKYSCACGGDCCQTISQKAGKCQCGKELAKAPEEKKEK